MRAEGVQQSDVEVSPRRQVVLRDVLIVLSTTLFSGLLFAYIDLSEALYRWTRRLEGSQSDEVPFALLVLAIGCIWFAIRRFREVESAIRNQMAVEGRLTEALIENRRLSRQNVAAQEAERRSITRELHDEMGQYLNAIKIDAVAIRDSSEVDARESATHIAKNIDHVYSVVTTLIRKLRPIGLDELGLVAALEQCVEQWRPRLPQTQIEFSAVGKFEDIREQASLTLYRVTQEALTNIAKYANARHVTILVAAVESGDHIDVFLDITDDGKGMDLSSRQTGYGLGNMRERIKMHGGQLEMESAPGQGFRLHATFAEQKLNE